MLEQPVVENPEITDDNEKVIVEQSVLVKNFNNNAVIIENAVELAAAVLANIDETFVGNKLNNNDLTMPLLRSAIIERIKLNFRKIKN